MYNLKNIIVTKYVYRFDLLVENTQHYSIIYLLTLLKYSLARFGSGLIVGLSGFQFIGQTKT